MENIEIVVKYSSEWVEHAYRLIVYTFNTTTKSAADFGESVVNSNAVHAVHQQIWATGNTIVTGLSKCQDFLTWLLAGLRSKYRALPSDVLPVPELPWPLCVLFLLILLSVFHHARNMAFIRRNKDKQQQWDHLAVKTKLFSVINQAYNLAKTAYGDGHCEQLIALIEQHTLDINISHCTGEPALFLCACLSGERGIIEYMLQKGGDPNLLTREGDSCLYLATYGILNSKDPDTDVLQDLKNAGANVNAQNRRGYTPLHRAACKGNVKVIKALLKLGADPYITNNTGIYPLDSAINAGHVEAAKFLAINLDPAHVWDIVEPHTPPAIRLGLQSPYKKHLTESHPPPTPAVRLGLQSPYKSPYIYQSPYKSPVSSACRKRPVINTHPAPAIRTGLQSPYNKHF